MRICFSNRHMFTIGTTASPKCSTILKTFLLCSLTCCQIWLNLLVNDGQPHRPHKFENEKKVRNLELGSVLSRELRWRCCCCFCVTYVRVARIWRDRPHTLVSTTSADIPLESTAFRIKHYKLVDFTSSSSLSNRSSSGFWLILLFEVANSSTRGISQIFKGGRVWRIWPTYTRGQRFVSLFFERERENTGFGAWFFFFKDTDWQKDRAKGREEWRIFGTTTCDSRVHQSWASTMSRLHDLRHQRQAARAPAYYPLAPGYGAAPQPALTTRPQGRTMAEIHRWWCSRFKGWVVLGGCTQISSIRICRRKSTGINRMNIGPKWELWGLRLLLLWVYHPYYWSQFFFSWTKRFTAQWHILLFPGVQYSAPLKALTNCRLRASFH